MVVKTVNDDGATEWPVGRGNYDNNYNVNAYNYNNRASRGIAFSDNVWGFLFSK